MVLSMGDIGRQLHGKLVEIVPALHGKRLKSLLKE
jgi:hypothetical protein